MDTDSRRAGHGCRVDTQRTRQRHGVPRFVTKPVRVAAAAVCVVGTRAEDQKSVRGRWDWRL